MHNIMSGQQMLHLNIKNNVYLPVCAEEKS